ncbi:hypothetical protein OE88DRAFT_784452 [Heliocybe sulcata]|uniref:DUF1989 domain-containing protein n=1 Tax=Heliocybe sulcata TaxID=5364 RepID=A0A5C3MV44_9AGAM|nr:hypothetical protein OE88DRAFT_784452 [Heliocybe sulcata]
MPPNGATIVPHGTIPARSGVAFPVGRGQSVRIINTHGSQVVDFFAFSSSDPLEYLSMQHTRASLNRITPKVGDTLTSSKRRPMLTITEDTTPGVHDTLIAACDPWRYQELGVEGWHASCAENLEKALAEKGIQIGFTPSPFNLFMNIPVKADGSLSFEEPVTSPEEYIEMRAEMDLLVACSACPQDVLKINNRL